MSKQILITGANGQLGKELQALSREDIYSHLVFHFTTKETLNICDKDSIHKYCTTYDIDIIINCAAYTGVDKAEEEEEQANIINHLAVGYLAEVAKSKEIQLIHISTDYVFDGTNYKPYEELDSVNPKNVYGKTKLEGEQALIKINPSNSIIIRTSWVYSSFGSNFVKTMLRLGKERDALGIIFDQIGSPTYAYDLAKVILYIIGQSNKGTNQVEIYHYSNEGACSWYDFARTIFELKGITCDVSAITTRQYPTPAKRPHYSLLNKEKIKDVYNLNIPYWKESLVKCLGKIQRQIQEIK